MMKIVHFLTTLVLVQAFAEAADWNYDPSSPNGPANWGDDVPLCDAERQSPINIVTSDARPVSFEPFEFPGYKTGQEDSATIVSIRNVGHTATMFLDGYFGISGGGLPSDYMAVQAHFHWGMSSSVGSEHTIDGTQFPLEMHIVHFAHERYNESVFDAVYSEDHDALAVLGVLFEIGDDDNEAFEEVITGVSNVVSEGDNYDFQNVVSMYDLLPEDKTKFYRYRGSLTTPDCFQVIAWTVFAEPVLISESQVQKFRELTEGVGNDTHVIGNTYRPVQNLYGRTVYFNVGDDFCDSGVSNHNIALLTVIATMVLGKLL